MNWSIVFRSKFDGTILGWHDGSRCCWSTDSKRVVSYGEKEYAETVVSSLKEKYPYIAEYICVEISRAIDD